jgi:hypothetical protein
VAIGGHLGLFDACAYNATFRMTAVMVADQPGR